MNKTVFIIPGFSESKKSNPAYLKIAGYFKDGGVNSVIVDIDWKYKTMSDYIMQFKEIYAREEKGSKVYFLGFSYGAIIALVSSVELKPNVQILCSLSPYFKEDLPYIRESWKRYVGKKRIADFQKISFNALSNKISTKTIILAGNQEGKEVERRVKDANKRIKNSKLIIIPNAKHKIQQEAYLAEVKSVINNL